MFIALALAMIVSVAQAATTMAATTTAAGGGMTTAAGSGAAELSVSMLLVALPVAFHLAKSLF